MNLRRQAQWLALLSAAVAHAAPEKKDDAAEVTLEKFVVSGAAAGQFTAGGGSSKATLTPVEMLMIPGSAADVNRALQTLPGVQAADEGNALFVRGGDSRETGMWINGIRYPGTKSVNAPMGTFTGSISPWLGAKTSFAAGGFGAGTGDVLSGAVKIETVGVPEAREASVNLAAGTVAGAVSWPWSERGGMTVTATRLDLAPYFELFKPSRTFAEAPQGNTFSVAGGWKYRPEGEVRWFGLHETAAVALPVKDVFQSGEYRSEGETRFGVVSWREKRGAWTHDVSIGGGAEEKREDWMTSSWTTEQARCEIVGRSAWDAGYGIWRGGVEVADERLDYAWAFQAPGGSGAMERLVYRGRSRETLAAGWGELETSVARNVTATAGMRAWDSRRAGETGLDPRLALIWQVSRRASWSVAGGRYHQVAEGFYYRTGAAPARVMEADQAIVSYDWKRGQRSVRVEAYAKRYRRLAGFDREYSVIGDGVGDARGVDFMIKQPLPWEVSGRLTWSTVWAERTDPETGVEAPAPWAVRNSVVLIVERDFGNWKCSLAGRWANGRAFTPITGAVSNGGGGSEPVFGAVNSANYPSFRRIDCTLARTWEVSKRVTAVTYLAGFNLAGWDNVQGYEYSDDFRERREVPTLFSRGLFFGVNLIFR